MLNYDNYAVTLGRAVEVFRRGREAVPEQKVALRALAALARLQGVVVEVGGGELRMEGAVVPSALPGVSGLVTQLEGHDVTEIRIRRSASPSSLLELLRGVAEPPEARPPAVDLEERLRAAGVEDVEVRVRRRTSGPPPPPPPPPPGPAMPDATTQAVSADGSASGAAPPLDAEAAVAAVALGPEPPGGREHLEAAAIRIREELDRARPSGAVRALARLIQLEADTPPGQSRQALTGVIGLLLTDDALRGAMECADVEETRDAARRILRRGGAAAAVMLRTRLMTETDDGAARQTLQLLREQPEGLRSLILLVQHGDHAIIRRAASVLAALGVREAVPALSRMVHHGDPTIRAAVIAALARLATPQAIGLLGELLDRDDPDALAEVVDALGGPALGPLVPRMENVAMGLGHAGLVMAVSQALGRIGTPTAIAVLTKWAAPPGWRFWRRRAAVRLAAVAGLRVAAGPDALRVLGALSRDGNPAVRHAAAAAIRDRTIAAAARAP
jgi:hypothetical protein